MQEFIKEKDERKIIDFVRQYPIVLLGSVEDDAINVSDWLKGNGKKIKYFVCDEEKNIGVLEGIDVRNIDTIESYKTTALLLLLEDEKNEWKDLYEKCMFEHILLIKREFLETLRANPAYKQNNDVYMEKLKTAKVRYQNQDTSKAADVLLVTPPAWDVYTPFGAIPCLMAALQQDGVRVKPLDLGILCFHKKLRSNWKEYAQKYKTEEYYQNTVKKYVKNPYMEYGEYVRGLWFFDKEIFPLDEVKKKYYELNRVQIGVLDGFFQSISNSLSVNFDFNLEKNLKNAYEKYDKNILIDSLEEMGKIADIVNAPPIVGISLIGSNQFLPGCALAKMIKFFNPDTQIIVGGSALDILLTSHYEKKYELMEYFDYAISGEGETAIRKLVSHIKNPNETDVASVPNLIGFSDSGELILPEVFLEDVDSLPVPCFDGIDFELYLTPEPMIPYQASRGCHYGYCAFCNHNTNYRHNYRPKNAVKVVNDLLEIMQKYHIKCFQFVDEAIRPDCFAAMIDEMDKHKEFTETKWLYYSRVSYQYKEELLKKAKKNGCTMVMFGVETFNQRLLNFIKKGISAETSKYCIELFSKAGIKVYIWLMCNLPSETIEEMKEDIQKVKDTIPFLSAISVGPFMLDVNTDMYKNQEEYQIVRYDPYDRARFDSTNDGKVIDKNEVFEVYLNEYKVLMGEYFFTINRYTVFYDIMNK